MSEYVSRYWADKQRLAEEGASPALQQAAKLAWGVIDFVPARLTAVGFAVVGSFEDAIDSWRHYTQGFSAGSMAASENRNDGVVLAATAGAVNVRLGGNALKTPVKSFTAAEDSDEPAATQATPGREPELAHLRSVVGLVWRCVVLWMVLLALLTLARLLG